MSKDAARVAAARSRRQAEAHARFTAIGLHITLVGEPPEDLRPDEQHWWTILGKAVDAVGVLTAADLDAFRVLVTSYARLERLRTGGSSVRDWVSLSGRVVPLMERFGLTPGSRDKLRPVATPPARKDDPDDIKPVSLHVVPP